MRPPELGPRVLARVIDGVLVGIPGGIVASILGVTGGGRGVFGGVLSFIYESVAIASYGRTVGKNVCHIAVVDLEGRQPSSREAIIRAAVINLPAYLIAPRVDTVAEWAVLLFGLANLYVIAKRRDDRRGIHDLAAGTRAIATESSATFT